MSAGGVDAPRSVAVRDANTKALIDAAKVMPGTGDPEMTSDPAETVTAVDAARPVSGRPGMPTGRPGTR